MKSRRDVLSDPHARGLLHPLPASSGALGAVEPRPDHARRSTRSIFPVPADATPEQKQGAQTQAQQHLCRRPRAAARWRRSAHERAPQLSRQIPQIHGERPPPDTRQQILALKVAEASKPMALPGGIGVVMVCDQQERAGPADARGRLGQHRARAARRAGAALYARPPPRRLSWTSADERAARRSPRASPPASAARSRSRPGARGGSADLPPFFVIDDPARLERARGAAWTGRCRSRPSPRPRRPRACSPRALPVLPSALRCAGRSPAGSIPRNAPAVIEAIRRGGRAGPVAAARRRSSPTRSRRRRSTPAGFPHPGHTEFLGELAGGVQPVMMLVCAELRVVPVTVHVALKAALAALDAPTIVAAGRIAAQALAARLRHRQAAPRRRGPQPACRRAWHDGPRGDRHHRAGGRCAPARRHRRVRPAPPDTLFHAAARRRYDAVLCMYHDQALIPLKTIDFERGVNVTLGLPFIRTSPDHGTALDIAGTGIAKRGEPRRRLEARGADERAARGGGRALRLRRVTEPALPPLREVIRRHGIARARSRSARISCSTST